MIENSALFEDLQRLPAARVLCVGDVMLDKFVYGAVDRISPEAPIPVFLVNREKSMLGGAGNVVANIAALGAQATLTASIGDDTASGEIVRQLDLLGVATSLETLTDRKTTVKTRFIGAGQQMLRVDHEKATAIPASAEDQVIANVEKMMVTAGAIILSDYNKGLLTDKVIAGIIAAAKRTGKPVIVDPKGKDFARYRGATVLTPNRRELEIASGMAAGTDEELRAACMKIMTACDVGAILATRSQDGMALITRDQAPVYIPAQVREVFDVSGAGDTVIAVFATALAAGVTFQNAAQLSNIAAGIVVGKTGTATARPDEIVDMLEQGGAISRRGTGLSAKIANKDKAAAQAERWRSRNFRVGFTNGCFDLLHPGHLSTLRQAKEACDYLIVAINSDASVRRIKGPARPVQDEMARASILAAMEMVDMVVVFDEETPMGLLEALRPDVLVKGGQYTPETVVGYDFVTGYGGKVVRAEMEEGFSTTNTIEKISA